MKKALSITAGCLLSLFACYAASDTYRITGEGFPEEYNGVIFEGHTVYMINPETKQKLDSTTIKNGYIYFEGTIDIPHWVYLKLDDNQSLFSLILEPGDISLLPDGQVCGGTYNQIYNEYTAAQDSIMQKVRMTNNLEERQKLMDEYMSNQDEAIHQNADNPIGEDLFIKKALFLPSVESLYAELEKYPQMRFLPSIQKILLEMEYRKLFSAGYKFTDFTVTNESGSQSLSDYVGKGKPVLVDFWASWCGPCIREMEVLKELLAEYGDKGLEVLGVAVWDKPENTLSALEQLQLPWPQIINAQRIPTEIYGINAIPCILLISPDGTIVSRGLYGDELRQSVKELMDSLEAK